MIKKLYSVVVVSILLLFNSCDDQGELVEISQEKFRIVENIQDLSNNSYLKKLPYITINVENNSIILINLLDNEALAEFFVEADVRIFDIQQFPSGHYAVLTMAGMEMHGTEGFSWGGEMELTLMLLFLDEELNLVQEFEITDEQLMMGLFVTTLTYSDDRLKIYYAYNSSIYFYDASSQETTLITELDEGLFPLNLRLTSMNQLVFLADNLESSTDIYYGVIDLETKNTQYFSTDLPVSDMVVQGSYLLLTENPPPAFQGENPRSEVIVFNLITGDQRIIQLEGYESMNAVVVDDHYILTGSHEKIRLYELTTNDILLDIEPTVEMIRIDSKINTEGELVEGIYPVIHTFLAVDDGLYAIVFDIGDGTETFHVEFIEAWKRE